MALSDLLAAFLNAFKKPQPAPAALSTPAPANVASDPDAWLALCRPLTQASEACYLTAYCDPASEMGQALQRDGLWYKYLADRAVATSKYNGLRATPWTIGWGQTGSNIAQGTIWTQAQADAALDATLRQKATAVDRLVKVPLQPNQKAAIVDWTYNEGEGNLASSTMLKQLNAGNFDAAMTELLRWNLAGGKVNNGLLTRRAREKELFQTGVWQ